MVIGLSTDNRIMFDRVGDVDDCMYFSLLHFQDSAIMVLSAYSSVGEISKKVLESRSNWYG